ncbi:hypothetical protein LTR35_015104 [Friedmanniomyces endolithicus]|uniref:YAG7-like dimerisation domain-containing protein n=1 Tax=Friedmanniomyces endolithicus TaxID=329885 RepID=A0AAN6FGQ8_9PEZI|nr:hypothetical protein LTR35_015104 [Friedmanniomyces endolithicus]KAK0286480.1 hypothetical protein LTS00_010418 [Friedmanniomyces endolithicus]KAK0317221.1 hypothetical protein LTR82_011822 [Friedmanniomyces endolithicus]KAK1015349.1 hypothetical protein LTR54_003892 [Friedmanniomyces endolithicus]
MSALIDNFQPLTIGDSTESKSARKKKAKAEAAKTNGTAIPETPVKESSEPQENGSHEHSHIRELQKQIRNINKRLAGLTKTDAVVAENPGVSLDDLVSQKKINADQKAAAEKKPGLQLQLQQAEEQVKVFQEVDAGHQAQLTKQKDDLTSQHQKELEKAKEDMQTEGAATSSSELRKKLLVFSQFLRTAAAKRNVEDNSEPAENEAFEGALLLAYGGDEKAVDTAVAIIDGTDEKVPNIEGTLLEVRYSQIRKVSSEDTPFQTEEAWIDSVAEANAAVSEEQQHQQNPTGGEADTTAPAASDPTLVNAGLTELDAPQTNGVPATNHDKLTTPANASAGDEAGNLAGDRWDTGAGAQQDAMGGDEGYEIIPRPNDEVDIPAPSSATAPAAATAPAPAVEDMLQREKTSWADEANASAAPAEPASTSGMDSGNAAAESWDSKPAGQTQDTSTPTLNENDPLVVAAAESSEAGGAGANDGFQAVGGRGRGRGGRGDFFNRGGRGGDRGGGRGRGDFRGRGRGSFNRGGERDGRGGGEGGDRGRGGRGRGGMRGDGPPTRGDGAPRGDGGAPRGDSGPPRG